MSEELLVAVPLAAVKPSVFGRALSQSTVAKFLKDVAEEVVVDVEREVEEDGGRSCSEDLGKAPSCGRR